MVAALSSSRNKMEMVILSSSRLELLLAASHKFLGLQHFPVSQSSRLLFSLVALKDWELHLVDVIGAYLHGDLEEEIYMLIPEGVDKRGGERGYWKLKKLLYSLKQAGQQWKVKLDVAMKGLGLEKSSADNCLYILREDRSDKIVLLILVYVDDMAIAGASLIRVTKFKANFGKIFDITDLRELTYILGIQVTRDRQARTISLNQTAYHQILSHFGMDQSHPVSTPLPVKNTLSTLQSPASDAECKIYLEFANGMHYLEVVGALLYATQMRPDIQYAIGLILQFGGNPGIPHLEAAKRILRHLKGTVHFSLVLGHKDHHAVDLVGWMDSKAQDPDSRCSIGGFVFDIAGSSDSRTLDRQLSGVHGHFKCHQGSYLVVGPPQRSLIPTNSGNYCPHG